MTGRAIHVQRLDEANGAHLLLRQLNSDSTASHVEEDARLISRALDGLPLSLAYVAGYARQTKVSLKTILKLMERRRNSASIFDEDVKVFQYEKTFQLVFEDAFQELGADAMDLLHISSMLCADGIPAEMLYKDPKMQFQGPGADGR